MAPKALYSVYRKIVVVLSLAALLNGCGKRENTGNSRDAAFPADASGVHSYSTSFPRTENPISEGGRWVGGSAGGSSIWAGGHLLKRGRLWGDVQTLPGFAFGVDEPTKFGDPTAILAGDWGPTQTVTARVRIRKTPTGKCCREVELRLRTTISSLSITGYEAYCSVMSSQPYCHIARWNGPNGSYWNFETGSSEAYVADGDVMKATVTGTNPVVIRFFKNGVLVLEANDTGAAGGGFGAYGPFPSGNPGIGFYDDPDNNWGDFGFSSFSATDGNPNATDASIAPSGH